MQYLCRWLRVTLDYGPTNHPRTHGAVERLGGWLHEVLKKLYTAWSRRWNHYFPIAAWIHETTPDNKLPGNASPYRMLFGRNPRTQIGEIVLGWTVFPLDRASKVQ